MAKKTMSLFDRRVCYFCGLEKSEEAKKTFRSVIEIHHIVEKNEGGGNEESNKIPCCSTHHSMIHEGRIKLDRWYMTTGGIKFHWWDENGEEHWGARKI
jgi:predicted restriction endonuclease